MKVIVFDSYLSLTFFSLSIDMTSTSPEPLVTAGVKVGVTCTYLPEQSNPNMSYFIHCYDITIENLNDFPVQLISRHWDVFDNTDHDVVDGPGVVGETPVLAPGDIYQYQSGTSMRSRFGRMSGWYNFISLINQSEFQVIIPTFTCEVSGQVAVPMYAPASAA